MRASKWTQSAVRALSGLVAAAAVLSMAMVSPAVAADGTASLSSLKVSGNALTGVLTVRAGSASAEVDRASLSAKIGQTAVPVVARPVGQSPRSVMLVVDTSGSMGEAGMETVREAVAAFLAAVPADVAVGLVSFASTAGVDVPLTKDRARVQKAVNALKSRGETTLYDGVAVGVAALARAAGDRSMILLSDGGDTASKRATKVSATAALKGAGVRAEVIAFNTAESDTTVLRGFASAGGGTVAAAGNAKAVREAFSTVARVLDSQVTFSISVPTTMHSTQTVELRGMASGRPFTVRSLVDFAATPTPTSSTPTITETPVIVPDGTATNTDRLLTVPGMSSHLLVGLVLTGIGVLGLVLALVAPVFRSSRRRRVETIQDYVTPGVAAVSSHKTQTVTPASISSGLVNLGDKVMDGRESTSKTMALIERADLALRPGEWWVLRLVSLVASVAVSLLLFRGGIFMTLVAVVAGCVAGWLLPAGVLRFLARRRSKKFEGQLPDVLTLVASSLSSGFSLLQALDAVAKDAAEPSAKEFSRALAETRIGSDVSDALEKVAVRMDSANMRWTTMAIRIQREVGGNLAETLRTTAKTLREREELKRHVRALSAEGRLSAYILIALPIGIFVYTVQTNRDYVELLWTRPMGWAMLAAGVVSMVIGTFWMRKVVDVQV